VYLRDRYSRLNRDAFNFFNFVEAIPSRCPRSGVTAGLIKEVCMVSQRSKQQSLYYSNMLVRASVDVKRS
jgi:hypothetical protein